MTEVRRRRRVVRSLRHGARAHRAGLRLRQKSTSKDPGGNAQPAPPRRSTTATSEFLSRVGQLYDDALSATRDEEMAARLADGRARLAEPLRIAVAGRVSTGKSTLVNALLGLAVAPTAAGECTRVVAWFRYGDVDRADVVLENGVRVPVVLQADRALPAILGHPPEDVDHVDVRLYNEPLEHEVIIDTPGLAGPSGESVKRTERLLVNRSAEAAGRADALVYLINGELREDDANILEAFQSQLDGVRATAVNVVAVINKADKLGDAADPMPAAAARAAAIERHLGLAVGGVLPLVGLLGETVAVGRLTEARARRLAALATVPEDEMRRQLASVRRFLAAEDTVGAADRADLMRVLDLLGIRTCIGLIREGRTGAVALSRELERRSGMARLRQLMDARFTARADVLRAAAGLSGLQRAAMSANGAGERLRLRLRDALEELTLMPEMQLVREMEVLRDVSAGRVAVPEDLAIDLRRLTIGDTPLERLGLSAGDASRVERVALERVGRWRAWANDGRRRPAERRAATVVGISYAQVLREFQATGA